MERKSDHPSDRNLWQYLDEDRDAPDLTDHISHCDPCAERLEEMKNTMNAVTRVPEQELSTMLRARTMRSFMDYRRSRPSIFRLCMVKIPLYQVAGIVAAAVLLMQIIGSGSETDDRNSAPSVVFQEALRESLLGP